MTYCNLFSQMNFSFGFLAGSCLSNWLGNRLFGGWNSMFMTAPGNMYMYTYYPGATMNPFSSPDPGYFTIQPPDFTNIQITPPKFDYNCIWNNNNNYTYSAPQFNFTMPDFSLNNYQYGGLNNYKTGVVDRFEKSAKDTTKPTAGKHLYSTLTKEDAEKRAKNNPNLENISAGGSGWSIASNNFIEDIPYARKGTIALLNRTYKETGIKFYVTSALGTAGSPHKCKDSSNSSSHYNLNNPKLDLQPQSNPSDKGANDKLAAALRKTGLFKRVEVETDPASGKTHLDVQFAESAYA